MKVKVGILGGTFNPIHRGHIDLGLAIRQAFGLEKVLYILSARPPHKKEIEIAPVSLRWEMLLKALAPYPFFEASDIEVNRTEDSWTIDTIAQLQSMYPAYDFFFISGSEGFLKIKTWKNYRALLRMVSFIVVLRDESHRRDVEKLLAEENLVPCSGVPEQGEIMDPGVYIYKYEARTIGISSTLIRQKVKKSESIDSYVEGEIKKIMEEHKLYET